MGALDGELWDDQEDKLYISDRKRGMAHQLVRKFARSCVYGTGGILYLLLDDPV